MQQSITRQRQYIIWNYEEKVTTIIDGIRVSQGRIFKAREKGEINANVTQEIMETPTTKSQNKNNIKYQIASQCGGDIYNVHFNAMAIDC